MTYPSTVWKLLNFSFFSKSSKKTLFNHSFTVLVHYRSIKNIFILREWSPYLRTKYHVFRSTYTSLIEKLQDSHLLRYIIQYIFVFYFIHVRSPLLMKSRLIYFPLVTKMFQFTRFLFPMFPFKRFVKYALKTIYDFSHFHTS